MFFLLSVDIAMIMIYVRIVRHQIIIVIMYLLKLNVQSLMIDL